MTATDPDIEEYGADQITVLEGLEAVRKRPGMYIGSTGKQGLHHLLWEVVDNSVDEAMGGFCDTITVQINDDNSITVTDNGRGIPVEPQKDGSYKGMSTLEMVLTVLHAGGKFGSGAYQFSGGLHGVGISVVNALSSWVQVTVKRDGKYHTMSFHAVERRRRGERYISAGEVNESLKSYGKIPKSETGTETTFMPDERVFSTTDWDPELISRRLRQAAFLNPGLRFVFIHGETTEEFYFPNGLVDFIDLIGKERLAESDHDNTEMFMPQSPIMLEGVDDDIECQWQMCFRWYPDTWYRVISFANGIETPDGGTHVEGYQAVIRTLVNRYARQDHIGLLGPKDPDLDASDVRSGLGVIIAVKVKEPQFQGQTKSKLGNEEVKTMVRQGFSEGFWNWMQENPVEAKRIVSKAVDEMRLRRKLAAQADAERSKAEKRGFTPRSHSLPAKLHDCETKAREDAELFIVEGDSAAGPAKMARDPQTQAVLPIRGKILNVENANIERISNNKEVQDIIAAMGAGSEDHFDLSQARYGKVIILTDADDDGRHIQVLLMTLFFRIMREMVEDGRLYIARSPLFSTVIGDEKVYAHTIADRDEIDRKHPKKNLIWTRFKGLGEMDYDELGETAIDPNTRRIVRVTIDDIEGASRTIEDLMGTNSAAKWEVLQDVVVESPDILT